ncbi:DNA ligase 1 isoform X1 [Cryptotermes secundus]|uniref:DNA ligase 1 isoform X1 n=1 Tax=Cryptotermes secundus TaxID=105785 RepID=UPI000CD7D24C|nr:DNA ligase 1 isoform X1 [Cryptotermes secundus]
MEGKKSESRKSKGEGEELEDEAKSAAQERMTTVWEKQENKEEKPMERKETKIENKNLAEGEKQKEIEDIMEVKGEGEQEKDKRTGYFIMKKESVFDDISLTPEIKLQYSSDEDEEEEEDKIEEEKEEEKIDREAAIEKYKSLQTEGRPIVKKNIMLLKKLAEHFKKHKMEHVYKIPEPYSADQEVRYRKQLLAFEEIRTTEKKEREVITKELKGMKNQKDELVAELKVEFNSFIQGEREIGTRLINTKTGKVIHDRLVEKLLSKQNRKLKAVNEVRLAFIKLRDRVSAKEAELQLLETCDQNLDFIKYEQLRKESQSYADKIEKRDEELQQLQNKATSAMKLIAHMKGKSFAIDKKMNELCNVLEHTETRLVNAHGHVTDLKKRRDFLQSETLRLRREAGLLTHPHLLQDFAVIVEEATRLSAQVQNLKNSFYDKEQSLSKLRKSIDAHISAGSVGNTSSGTRPQLKESLSTNFTGRNLRESNTFLSKIPSLHSVSSDHINQLSNEEVKPCIRGKYSRPQSKHSFRSSPVTPVSKERQTFSPFSHEISLPKEDKPNLRVLKFQKF